jgi:type VI secretion system secreted protein VgrG
MMSIATPLGEDFLLIDHLSGTESLSSLFEYKLKLFHEETEAGEKPTIIDTTKILGQNVAISIMQRDGTSRIFNGMVNWFAHGNRVERFTHYFATVVPNVWVLKKRLQSRIFQQMTVPDILKKIFNGFNVSWEIQGTFHQRNYCVQYRETDFAFASRLMEEEGIFYYFEHTDQTHKMIVANTPQSHYDCPFKTNIPFAIRVEDDEDFISSVRVWQLSQQVDSGKVTLWDHHFELPGKKLEAEKLARPDIKASPEFEVYDYPGGFARKYDGIDKGGGEQASELQKVFTDNKKAAEIRMQGIDADYKVIRGEADCCSMTAGYRFKLVSHPSDEFNALYTLVSVKHEIQQSPDYTSGEENSDSYKNEFACIPNTVPFRPRPATPKPLMRGSQTAIVVGPAGEEIFTDKYGRVKVQFHWDREGKNDSASSCWVRVAQSWAGKKWGTMFIPRIGMEAIVDFLEGDPDQPIITGCVYNAETMPPYALPDQKTKTTLKSDSSPGGGGFNELRFEDKKGSEQIFIHGEKDIDVRIKKDSREWIGNERHLIVVKDKLEKIGGDKHLKVLGDKNEQVDGTVSLKAGQDLQEKVGQKYALDAGQEVHIKAGMNLVLESGTTLTLKVGGNFININSGGIFIKGTMVMINSGGAAGSGAGASPEAPKEAKEADKADPGARISPPPPSPPAPVFSYSPAAMVMKQAAKNGTPFCEICEKMARGEA